MICIHKTCFMENCVKCGITVIPPALLIFYKADDKLRRKTIPLRKFGIDSNCGFVAADLKQKYNFAVPLLKVEKMLRLIQEMIKSPNKKQALEIVEGEYNIRRNLNLNKLSTDELTLHKEEMDCLFTKNQIKPDSAEFKYDKKVDFGEQLENSNWDQDVGDGEDDFWG